MPKVPIKSDQPVTLRQQYERLMPPEYGKIPPNRRRLLDETVSIFPTQAEIDYDTEMMEAYLAKHPDQESLFMSYDDTPDVPAPRKKYSKKALKEFGKGIPRNQLEVDYVGWRRDVEMHLAYENLGLAYIALKRRHNTNDKYEDWDIHPDLLYIRYKDKTISFKSAKTRRKFLQHLFRLKRNNFTGRFYFDDAIEKFSSGLVTSHKTRKRDIFKPVSLESLFRKERENGHFEILFECIDPNSGYWFLRPPVPPATKT